MGILWNLQIYETERSGKNLRRATSSSGGTQPRYKVQGTRSMWDGPFARIFANFKDFPRELLIYKDFQGAM